MFVIFDCGKMFQSTQTAEDGIRELPAVPFTEFELFIGHGRIAAGVIFTGISEFGCNQLLRIASNPGSVAGKLEGLGCGEAPGIFVWFASAALFCMAVRLNEGALRFT